MATRLCPQPLEEVGHFDAEGLCQFVKPAGTDPVGGGLVFLDLLVGDIQRLAELFLGQAEFGAALADALADMATDPLECARCSSPKQGRVPGGGAGVIAVGNNGGVVWRHLLLAMRLYGQLLQLVIA